MLRERAGDPHPLLLSAGHTVTAAERPVEERYTVETSEREAAFVFGKRPQRPPERMFSQPAGQNVLQRGLPPDQLMLLEDHRRLRAVFTNVPGDLEGAVFGIHHPSGRGRNQKVQGAQQGRFAGAGRAEQNRDLIIHEIQGKGVKGPGAVGINHLDVPNSDY